jgi:hypothetical protein
MWEDYGLRHRLSGDEQKECGKGQRAHILMKNEKLARRFLAGPETMLT